MSRYAAWGLVALVAAWSALRLLGLEDGYPLVPLVAYTPYFAVVAVVATGVIAVLRQWLAAAVAGVLALLLVLSVLPRAVGNGRSADGPSLGVLSVNLYRGDASKDAVVELVRRTGADVLAVQEADAAALEAFEAAGLRDVLPHHVRARGVSYAGTALYSVHPLTPQPPPSGTHTPMATASLRAAGGPEVIVTATHPRAPLNASWTADWEADMERLPPAERDRLRILAGDFNSTLDHDLLRELIDTGYVDAAEQVGAGLQTTWPVGRRFPPPVTIDHVLADERCGVRRYDVLEVPGSDHRAVFAEIVLPAT